MDTTIVAAARRVVVKVGTSLLTQPNGRLDVERMRLLVGQLAGVITAGREVILVTSGAIGAGVGSLGFAGPPSDLTQRQALAAIGQGILMHTYENLFGEHGIRVAQILLVRDDFEHPRRRANAHATVDQLLKWGALPIVNENDTVANEEIRIGDNDNLSAQVAVLARADLLIILSDVGGFYRHDPRQVAGQGPIPVVRRLTQGLLAAGGGPGSANATGGMATKLEAAQVCLEAGIPLVIADGNRSGILADIVSGTVHGTLFVPEGVGA